MVDQMTPAEMGRKGGHARAANLTADERKAVAVKAAKARWAKYGKPITVPVTATVQLTADGRWEARLAGTEFAVTSRATRNDAVRLLADCVAEYYAIHIRARIVSLACDMPRA